MINKIDYIVNKIYYNLEYAIINLKKVNICCEIFKAESM